MEIIYFAIIVLVVVALIFTLVVWHYPHTPLSTDLRQAIKQYGLVHFTFNSNTDSIVKNGVEPDNSRKMSWLEKDMVWTYINYPGSFDANLADVRRKGKRKDYDAAVYIKELTDEQIDQMRQLRQTNVIVFRGTLKTLKMIPQAISGQRSPLS